MAKKNTKAVVKLPVTITVTSSVGISCPLNSWG